MNVGRLFDDRDHFSKNHIAESGLAYAVVHVAVSVDVILRELDVKLEVDNGTWQCDRVTIFCRRAAFSCLHRSGHKVTVPASPVLNARYPQHRRRETPWLA